MCDGPVALGHRRLSIIDVAGGAQPMCNEDGTVWITLQRRALQRARAPHRARGQSVIAIRPSPTPRVWCIFTRRRGRIRPPAERHVCAGDLGRAAPAAGAGARPDGPEAALLRRAARAAGLRFGSEPKAMLAPSRDRPRRSTETAWPATCSMNTCRLPTRSGGRSGSCPAAMFWSGKQATVRVSPYWNPPVIAIEPRARLSTQTGGAVLERVSRCGGATSAVGCAAGRFLVGGRRFLECRRRALRDRAGPERAHRFRSASRIPSFDESGHARAGRPLISGPTTTSGLSRSRPAYDLLPEVAAWLDEPFGDASILPTHLLSRFRARARSRWCWAATGPMSFWPAIRHSRPSEPPVSSAGCPGRHGLWPVPRSGGCRSITAISASTSSSSSFCAGPPSPCHWPTSAGWVRSRVPRSPGLLVSGDPMLDVEAEHLAQSGVARRAGLRSAHAIAGAVSGHLPARGHPDQGRSGEHGLRTGGPGAVPRRRAGRFGPGLAGRRSSSGGTDQAAAQAGRRESAAGVDPEPPQEGFWHPGGGAGCGARSLP